MSLAPRKKNSSNRKSDTSRLSSVVAPPPPPSRRGAPPPPPGGKASQAPTRATDPPHPPPRDKVMQPSPPNGMGPPPPPPPVVLPPARPRLGSALKADISKAGLTSLRKTSGPRQRASISNRNAMLAGIKKGNTTLNKVRRPSQIEPKQKEQSAAITAILSNRAKIAGDSDSSDDSSDSEISF